MHPFIHIGALSLPMYGLCAMVGTIFALLAVFRLRKKGSPISEDNLLDALIWAILLGFICSKLLYFIVEPPQMPHSWAEVWELISTGLVFYGGLLGGLLGLVFASRKTGKSFLSFTDLMAPCFCLAHAGGRIGCLMAGCCYGMPYSGPCAVVLDGVSRLPTQPMEAIFLVILSVVLIKIFLKKPRRGTVTGWYMVLYAVWRFIIEFFRADERGTVGAEAAEPKEPKPAPAERPETAPLPADPLEAVNEDTGTEIEASEVSVPEEEVAGASAELSSEGSSGAGAADADGGPGDGGDQ